MTDEAGTIVKVCDPDCSLATNPQYLVTWNGHGDALALWRQNADGTLTLAISYTHATWGTPTTAVHNAIPDLGFRFLYVGSADVQWDDFSGAGLLYMHARHYSPLTGRFLQPDPSAAEPNLYEYAGGSPVTNVDPSGLDARCDAFPGGYRLACEGATKLVDLWPALGAPLGAFLVWLIWGKTATSSQARPRLPAGVKAVSDSCAMSFVGCTHDDNRWRRELDRGRRLVDQRLGIRYHLNQDYAAPGGPAIGPPRMYCSKSSARQLRCAVIGGAGVAVVIYYTVNQTEIDRRADGKR